MKINISVFHAKTYITFLYLNISELNMTNLYEEIEEITYDNVDDYDKIVETVIYGDYKKVVYTWDRINKNEWKGIHATYEKIKNTWKKLSQRTDGYYDSDELVEAIEENELRNHTFYKGIPKEEYRAYSNKAPAKKCKFVCPEKMF